ATFALASSAWAARQDAAASCGVLSCRKAAGGEGWRVVVERLPVAGWDRVWLDFRDDFGFVWAKRVQDRFNAAAGQLGWPIVLGWSGFRPRITPGTAGLREGQPKESSMNYFGVSAPPTPTFPHQGGGSDSWTAPKGANAAGIVTAILSQPGAVQTAFVSLLQRFVSQEWIRARLTAR
ncbi:MAG: hypothetical protein HY000_34495, partial [Planctomycetes bacterium]|nr:hypothetical protein [Planctomycetota bacterium]